LLADQRLPHAVARWFEHQTAAAASDFLPTLFFGVPTIYVRLSIRRRTRAKSAV
jgi:hypothetical protein